MTCPSPVLYCRTVNKERGRWPGVFPFGVALASFATIALELLLTRIYSVTMYYHFAFMVISLALLGLAVAGVTTYLLPTGASRADRQRVWPALSHAAASRRAWW